MKRLTPEREKLIRVREFFGIAKKVIEELLYEIDELRIEVQAFQSGYYEDEFEEDTDEDIYQKFQETQKERDNLKTVLKTAIKNDTVNKLISKSGEK